MLTPWNLRFHGPRPDCWTISDDGYGLFFRRHLSSSRLKKFPLRIDF